MFPSNTNANSFPDNDSTYSNLRFQDLSSSSSSLYHFPSPLIHYEDDAIFLQQLHDILLQNDQGIAANETMTFTTNIASVSSTNDVNKKESTRGGTDHPQIPRKRTSKKDRHSKINTAQGPRDRRMRLSLDVARKFFSLQDMLEFDKASKTVEWLLTQSKIAINELRRGIRSMKHSSSIATNSASSTSECEVLSGIDEPVGEEIATKELLTSPHMKQKKTRAVRKATSHPVAKEAREKARARARERTREKKIQQVVNQTKQYGTEGIDLLSWSQFEINAKQSIGTQNNQSSFEEDELQNPREREMQVTSQGGREEMVGDSLFITGNWSPSTIFNYQHSFGISNEHQLIDFQYYGKPWEG